MRLLRWSSDTGFSLTENLLDDIPPYAILSHTWGADKDEVTYTDVHCEQGQSKHGYAKLRFCKERASIDGLEYFWVDTCCINKADLSELSEAITSMYRWYRNAVKCYVYLDDVSSGMNDNLEENKHTWQSSFRTCRWFTRGWTLQELLAPRVVEFFSREGNFLGSKNTLVQLICDITHVPVAALQGTSLSRFSISERMKWAEGRNTKRKEDKAYCLFGIFDIFMPLIYGEEDNALIRLTKAIQERYGSSTASVNVHWIVPRTANPLFTGRSVIINELTTIIRKAVNFPFETEQCRIVILGMGGQGKSEICLQVARQLRSIFWAIIWVDVSTKDLVESSYMEAAQKLSIPAETWIDARNGISNLRKPWLLVLDNADEQRTDYQDCFPEGSLGVVLMTTRIDECLKYANTKAIALEGLHGEDARMLLLKTARIQVHHHSLSAEAADKVAVLLQSHPLALIQAGAYAARGHCTLVDYPDVYKQQQQRLLTFRPTQAQSRYGDVYATFEASAEVLKAMDSRAARDALTLLSSLAICSPVEFPLFAFKVAWQKGKDILTHSIRGTEEQEVRPLLPWHVEHLPPFVDVTDQTWDSFRLMEAVALLKAFSLISINILGDGFPAISMHTLVHAWSRDRQNDHERHHSWLQMCCTVALACPRAAETDQTSEIERQRLQHHLETLLNNDVAQMYAADPTRMITPMIIVCADFVRSRRSDARLSSFLHNVFVFLGLDPSNVDDENSGLYELKALELRDNGKTAAAVKIYEQLIHVLEPLLARNSYARQDYHSKMAAAYLSNGQVHEALRSLEEVSKVTNSFAWNSPDRLTSENILAQAYILDGRPEEALPLLEQILKARESMHDHGGNRLLVQRLLASVYLDTGQVDEAIKLLQVILTAQQSLSKDDQRQLATLYELGTAYLYDGQTKQSISVLEEVVATLEQVLPQSPERILQAQHMLAVAYQQDHQFNKATELLETVVRISQKTLSENHRNRILAEQRLASFYWSSGRKSDALELSMLIVEVVQTARSETDPTRLESERLLAWYKREMDLLPEEEAQGSNQESQVLAEDVRTSNQGLM